jgi:GT2 family glycosyltransferase
MPAVVSVGITTRDRPESLRRCLESLACVRHLIDDTLIFDDGSRDPVTATLPEAQRRSVRVLRDDESPGYIVGRNRLVEAAARPWVLLLDDDTRWLSADALAAALEVFARDRTVAAVAFAQAEEDGRPWPARMQPSPASDPRRVRSFIGFAHLIRRDVFRALGGYREIFGFYGEEKEYSLRLIEAGYSVVYLPAARVAHVIDKASRDQRRYLRCVTRNDCLNALFNDPWPRVWWTLPGRLALYFRMRSAWKIRDPGGFWWLIRDLMSARAEVRRVRRPVSRRTIRRWRELGVTGESYTPPV